MSTVEEVNPAARMPSNEEMAEASDIVHEVLAPTPLIKVSIEGTEIWLKGDGQQPTGSFKVRGALAAVGHLAREARSESVLACSAGNHALGIAFASEHFGVPATVVVPETASIAKVEKLRTFAVELILHGQDYDEAEQYAVDLAQQRSSRFISPYNDAWVIAGQATAAEETLATLPTLGTFIVAVGGGGLLSGSGLALQGSSAKALGVQVEQNAAFSHALAGDFSPSLGETIADGIAGGIESDSVTLDIVRELGLEIDLVSEEETVAALVATYRELGVKVEGSAAVSIALAIKRSGQLQEPVAVLLCGSNIDAGLHQQLIGE